MQPCLHFVTEKWDPLSAWIRLATRSPISHVEFRLADGRMLGALLNGGVQVRPAGYAKWTTEYFYTAPGIEDAVAWARMQVGKPYDWRAILGIATDQNWHHKNDFICSELVMAAFVAIGKPLLNPKVRTYQITPRDLLLSPYLTEVKQ